MIYITAVHMSTAGSGHEHIVDVRWQNPSDNTTGQSTRQQIVDWIRDQRGDARVSDGRNEAKVGVVDATPPFIRTYADGKWTDNLPALPRY